MRRFTKDHEWIEIDGETGSVGITGHARTQLGDIVYCEVLPPGTVLSAGETAGAVESVKAAADILSPCSGEIIEVNAAPQDDPSLLSAAPEETWLFRLRLSGPREPDGLMDAEQYKVFCDG